VIRPNRATAYAAALPAVALVVALGAARAATQPPSPGAAEARWCAEGAAARRAAGPPGPYDDLAQRLPGFAGYAAGGDTLVLWLVDRARRAAAEAAVRCFDPDAAAAGHVAVRRARYTLAQLHEWRGRLRASPPPGATTWHADRERNRVVVGLPDSAAFAPAHRALRRLGIPGRAVVLIVATNQDL
jgi:hypothetical protein